MKQIFMVKKLLFVILLSIFLIEIISALDIFPDKSYIDPTLEDQYGTIKIINFFGLFDEFILKEVKLTKNTDYCLTNCYAEGITTMYSTGKLFDKVEFRTSKSSTTYFDKNYKILLGTEKTRIKEIPIYKEICVTNKNLTQTCNKEIINYITEEETYIDYNEEYYNTEVKEGIYYWKIEGTKNENENLDWVATFNGIKGTEWATWNSTFSNGLVVYYNFNETTGDLIDVHQGLYNGTINGTTQGAGGKIENAYSFDGTDDNILLNSNLLPLGTQNFTISVWVYTNYSGSAKRILSTGTNEHLILQNANPPMNNTYVFVGGTSIMTGDGTKGIKIGQWDNLVVMRNGIVNSSIYVNGAYQTSGSHGNNVVNTTLFLGGFPSGENWIGLIDEFAMWNRTLSEAEVTDLYNAGSGISYTAPAPTFPTITINTPIDNYNSSISTIILNGTATITSPYNLVNISLWINGTINYTFNLNGGNQSDGFSTLGSGSVDSRGMTTNGSDFWISDITKDFIFHFDKFGNNITDGFSTLGLGSDLPTGIATNGSDFWISDNTDDFVYHTDKLGNNQSDGFSTLGMGCNNPFGIATNGSDFWIVDEIDNFVYHTDKLGNNQSDGFSISSIGIENGIEIATNGSDFWIVDYVDFFVYHTNVLGNNQSDGFSTAIFGGAVPRGIVVINNSNFWIIDPTDDFVYHINRTATKNQNLTTSINFPDGIYNWTISSDSDATSTITGWGTNRTLTIDTTYPTFTLNSLNNVSTLTFPTNATFNVTTIDAHIGSCWFSTSESATNISYNCNNLTNVSFSSGGLKNITIYANDTFSHENYTIYPVSIYDFTIVQHGSATDIEETSTSFSLQVNSTSFDIEDAEAGLWYNNTYLGYTTKTLVGTKSIIFNKTFNIPFNTGNSTGNTIEWNWTYNATHLTNRYSSNQSQVVYKFSAGDCITNSGKTILNLSIRDEEELTLLNVGGANTTVIELDLEITDLLNSSLTWNFSKKWIDNQSVAVCVPYEILNSTNFTIDFLAGFQGTDHVQEFYYMDNGSLDNTNNFNSYTSHEIDLMDLLTADSTTFLFTFTGEDGLEVDDAVVHVYRNYIGEGIYREVERSKQDDNGQTHVHLVEEDVIYYFVITQYGNIIYTSSIYNAKCLSTPCEITLSASPSETNWSIYDNEGGKYKITSNKTSRITSLAFDLDNQELVNFTIYQSYNGLNTIINTSGLNSSSGTIDLYIPNSYNNATFFAVIYNENQFVKSNWVSLRENANDYFGTFGALLGGLIVLSMLLMAITEGIGLVIFIILSIILIIAMQLVDLSWMAIISIICAGGIIVWKLVSRRNKGN